MTIDIQITWTIPSLPLIGSVNVTFDEVKLPEGYHIREITNIVFPLGFPRDQRADYYKSIYHRLNFERQKVVIDDVSVES